jgi:hypothetical protein
METQTENEVKAKIQRVRQGNVPEIAQVPKAPVVARIFIPGFRHIPNKERQIP